MRKAIMFIAAALSLLVVSIIAPPAEAAIGCGTVVSSLSGCLPYVTDQGPLGNCCGGLKSLFHTARTTRDHKTVCTCLKSLGGSYSGVNLGKVARLPRHCGVYIPYKLAPSTDCNKVR